MNNTEIKLVIRGVEVTCHDIGTALKLIDHATLGATPVPEEEPARRRGRPPKGASSVKEQKQQRDLHATLDFLHMMDSAGTAGVAADALVEQLNLKGARGIGAATAKVKRVLSEYGLSPKRIYAMKGQRTSRRWKRGPDVREAIRHLDAVLTKSSKGGEAR